jgi:hypothetical protein
MGVNAKMEVLKVMDRAFSQQPQEAQPSATLKGNVKGLAKSIDQLESHSQDDFKLNQMWQGHAENLAATHELGPRLLSMAKESLSANMQAAKASAEKFTNAIVDRLPKADNPIRLTLHRVSESVRPFVEKLQSVIDRDPAKRSPEANRVARLLRDRGLQKVGESPEFWKWPGEGRLLPRVVAFNPNHDELGRFAESPDEGGGAAGGGSAKMSAAESHAKKIEEAVNSNSISNIRTAVETLRSESKQTVAEVAEKRGIPSQGKSKDRLLAQISEWAEALVVAQTRIDLIRNGGK